MASPWVVFAISCLATLGLVPLAKSIALRTDFLDYPAGHKSHRNPVPLLGGLAVFVGLTLGLGAALVLGWISFSNTLIGFYSASALLVIFGLLDDKFGLSPAWKLTGQLAAVIIFLAFFEAGLSSFPPLVSLLILVFWLVGLVNALNFLDNMDGLCSGITVIASAAFGVIAFLEGSNLLLVISLAVAGSYLAFFRYNFAPAKIFLGDAGSMLSGFTLATLGLLFVTEVKAQYALLIPLLILSYPIFDISFVTFTRLKQGRKFYQGGQDHSSHRLVYLGVTSKKAVRGILLISFFLAITGIVTFYYFDSPLQIFISLAIAFGLTLFGIHLHRNFINFKEKLLLISADLLILNLSFLAAGKLSQWMGSDILTQGGLAGPSSSTLAIILTFFWVNLFAVAGLYEFYWGKLVREEVKATVKTVAGGGMILALLGGAHLFSTGPAVWSFVLYLAMILAGLVGFRSMLILIQRRLVKLGKILNPAVIVGTENAARKVLAQLQESNRQGLRVMGLIDENHNRHVPNVPVQVLGQLENLEQTLRKNKIREVLIAVEPNWPGTLDEVLETGKHLEVNFRLKADLLERARGHKVVPLADPAFYKIYPSQMRTWEWGIKRITDIAISLTLILLTFPVWAGFYIKSWIAGQKGTFESLVISGKQCRALKLYQFKRSGRIRLWHKLPLLLSVLKGDLSLIGPMWIRLENQNHPQNFVTTYGDKLRVRPGLITPYLKNGEHSDNGGPAAEEKLDLDYIENMSFTRDWRLFLGWAARSFSKSGF